MPISANVESQPENPNWRNERRREVRLRRSNLISDQCEGSVTYKVATDQHELERSFELVWQSYVKVGLQAPDSDPIRFTKYHLLPSTKVFIAIYRPELLEEKPDYSRLKEPGEIVGTLTLVANSPMGLPMEEVCHDAVQELRDQGSHPAEVVALAVNPEYRRHNIMMYLYKLMFEYANLTEVSDITCSVTKRHISFYQSMLLFQPMGELQTYSAANGLEVQCHRLNIEFGRQTARDVYNDRHFDADLYTFFFTENPQWQRSLGMGRPWSEELLRYFLTKRTRFLDTLDEKTRALLRREYSERSATFPF
jgi:ribosomal protein S18 acetylase RimI-like enzyme